MIPSPAPGSSPRPSTAIPGVPIPAHAPADRATVEQPHGFDIRHFWQVLMSKVWVVALCVVAGLFVALGYLARTPKLYQGHIVLEVDVQDPTPMRSDDSARMRTMFLASQEAMRTIEQNLVNRSLLARVVRSEGLAEDGGAALLGNKGGAVGKVEPAATAPSPAASGSSLTAQTFTPIEEGLGGALSTMVKPVIRRGTRLIDVYVTHTDPAMAQRLVEAVGREYIRYSIERRSGSNEESLRYLLEEEERLKRNLQRSEAAVAEYKANTPDALQLGGGASSTGSQAGAGSTSSSGGLVENKLQDLSTKLTAAKADRMRLEGELAQIEQAGDNVDQLLAVPSIGGAANVLDRRRDVGQLEGTVAGLSQRYKDKHPKMMAARAALSEAQAALKRAVLAQPAVVRNLLEQARAAEASLSTAGQEQEKSALALNKAAIGYQELARQAETDRALYESVLRQIKETNLTKDVKTNAVSISEHSTLSRRPVSPNPTKSVALGLLGGLALGLGLIYGLHALDRTIRTVDQAESTLHLPVLAAVPDVRRGGKKEGAEKKELAESASYRLVAEAPEGPAAEAVRNLRASMSLLGPEAERRISLFTSAVPGEGKSFMSANYALALAQQGHRVLLIDGDLRRPSIHKIFPPGSSATADNEKASLGIVDCLIGTVSLADAARPLPVAQVNILGNASLSDNGHGNPPGRLSILAKGTRAPSPAELLSGPSFAQLIADAARLYDRVVIDSAPVLAVADTLLMVPYVQNVCIVLRASSTARNAVWRSIALLGQSGVRPVGLVLNRLPRHGGAGYYYYYAAHGYGAGEGAYGSDVIEEERKAARTKAKQSRKSDASVASS